MSGKWKNRYRTLERDGEVTMFPNMNHAREGARVRAEHSGEVVCIEQRYPDGWWLIETVDPASKRTVTLLEGDLGTPSWVRAQLDTAIEDFWERVRVHGDYSEQDTEHYRTEALNAAELLERLIEGESHV